MAVSRGVSGGYDRTPPAIDYTLVSPAGLVAAGRIQSVHTHWPRNFCGLGIFAERFIAVLSR